MSVENNSTDSPPKSEIDPGPQPDPQPQGQTELKPEVKEDPDVAPASTNHVEIEDDDELPFPGFVPKAFNCLPQTNFIRMWCLRTITWPYPFIYKYNISIIQWVLKKILIVLGEI